MNEINKNSDLPKASGLKQNKSAVTNEIQRISKIYRNNSDNTVVVLNDKGDRRKSLNNNNNAVALLNEKANRRTSLRIDQRQ